MDRIVIVSKPSRLDELIREHLTEGAAEFILKSQGQSIEPYRREDAAYKDALTQIHRQMPSDLPVSVVSREEVPNFLFREKDIIVVCGPDGLFVNLAKYIDKQPVITVNPDPRTVAGILMLFSPQEVGSIIAKVREGTHTSEPLPFIKATVGDKIVWGINDIFIGRRDHISSRYEISFDGESEHHSSSGIIVSTGIGSTGWMRSVASMVAGLTREGMANKLSMLPDPTDNQLVFVVREPFPSPETKTHLVTGRIVPGTSLTVVSEMPKGGCIFSDGVVEKAIQWGAGSTVTVSVGDRYVTRVTR